MEFATLENLSQIQFRLLDLSSTAEDSCDRNNDNRIDEGATEECYYVSLLELCPHHVGTNPLFPVPAERYICYVNCNGAESLTFSEV